MGAAQKAVVLISNDLSHPALQEQQYSFSWRINRLRPLLKRGYTLVLVAGGGRVGRRGRPTLASLRPRITNDGRLVTISPPIVRIPMLWLLQSMFVTPLMVFLYCRQRRLEVEAVVASAVPYGVVGRFVNRVLHTALVVDYGDPDFARESGLSLRILHLLESYVFTSKRDEAVTCIDPNICDYVKRYGREDAVFLPPGGFWADERREGKQHGTVGGQVIYAGHLAPPPAYRLDLLADAFPLVLKKFPGARFVILGEGDYLPTLRARVTKLGLTHSVELPGAVTYEEAKRRIRESQVAVQALNDMCLGTKVMDYLSEGKAVVSCGSFYDSYSEFLVNGKNCILVPPNATDLSDAIVRILSDPGLRQELETNALRTVERYDYDSQADAMLELVGEVRERIALSARP